MHRATLGLHGDATSSSARSTTGGASCRAPEDLPGAPYVVPHGLDQRVEAVEAHHRADPLDEGDLDLDVVQLQVVTVEHVGLHAPLTLPVEGRVRADADRGRE